MTEPHPNAALDRGLLRGPAEGEHHKVGFIELFFDLVFVFAVTELSHGLVEHFTQAGAWQTLVLMLAVWWVWISTAWVTNWLDPERKLVRGLLLVLMLLGLVMSASITQAFGARALVFALAFAAMQVGRPLFFLWAVRGHARLVRNFQRILVWSTLSSALWIAGAMSEGASRTLCWVTALGLEYLSPSLGFRVPWLGRSTTQDWDIDGGHMAERCGLFIIIALGESVLVTGASFAALEWRAEVLAAFLVAFVGSVTMWWIYFDTGAKRATKKISESDNPGWHARMAYTYLHLPIVAGIIVGAVADEIMLKHPDGTAGAGEIAVIVGGPALYLLGNALFKWSTHWRRRPPRSHMGGLLGLLGLWLVAWQHAMSPLMLGALAAAVLMVVAVWETIALRRSATA